MSSEEAEVASLRFSPEIISASFTASGGRLEAHALFIRGLALSENTHPLQVAKALQDSYRSLTAKERQTVLQAMAHGHQHNPLAKSKLVDSLSQFRPHTIDDHVIDQLYKPLSFDSLNAILEARSDVTQPQVDAALKKIFFHPDQTPQLIQDVKSLSAYLGLYEQQQWWRKMTENDKAVLINHGKRLVIDSQ